MPVFSLTSPKTGKSYKLDINGTPEPDEWDHIGEQLDAQEAQRAGVDPAVLEQGPVGTFVNTVRNIGPEFLAGPVAGLAKLNETLGRSPLAAFSPLGLANQATAMMTGINPLGGVERAAEVIQQEGQDMRPTNPFNPTAQTVGQAVNQIGGMIATGGTAALAGMPARTAAMVVPQVYGLAAGAGQGIDTAREMGITDPTAQAGMGLAFGGVEALTEKIGGIGGDAVNKFINPTSLLGRSALNTISESGEEILAGRAQDAITVGAGQFVSDPNRPGFTRSGFQLPSLNPLNPDTLARMKQEAIGGTTGGVIFSGLQALSPALREGVGQPMSDPGAPDVPESTGELTAADVADLEQAGPVPSSQFSVPGSQISPEIPASTDPTQTITGSNGEMAPEMPVPPPTADAGAGAGVTGARRQVPAFRDFGLDQPQPASGDVITDLRIPRSPEAIAETQRLEQERMSQEAKLRSQQAKAGRGPVIPDSPLGVYDILDFVNENRIRLPKKGEERGAEYDWAETYSIPTYYRQFLGNTERGANIDQVAQMAFENGFIREPTADALMGAIQQGIDTRKQYKVQFAQRAKEQAQVEKQVLDFEKTQGKLRSKDKDRIAFENIAPGDEMTIDGERAVVRNIEYTEDGELTNVVIEDGKRFGLMQFDPQRREGIFVDEFTPRPRPQPEGEAVFSPASRNFTGGLAGSLQQAAGVLRQGDNQTRRQGDNQTGSLSESLPVSLSSAYATASQGRSTAMVELGDVWAAAKAAQPDLQPGDFIADVMRQYEQGTVLLEGANSRQEADAAGLRIDGTPVGTAVRMAMVPPDGGMANDEGRSTKALQNPASVTPAQDAAYLAAVQAGDLATAQKMVDEAAMAAGYVSAVKHGTHNNFSIFDTSKGRNQGNRFEMNNWGIWTTEDDASIYGPKVLKLYGKSSSPLRVQNFEDWFDDYVKHAYPLFYFKGITADELAKDLRDEASAYFKRKKDIPASITRTEEYQRMLADQPGAAGYSKSLKDRGFDSVLIEGGFIDGQLQTVRIYLDSNQLKSADPVTYDDAGNVIPLSQRFQESSPDIRYSPAELAATEQANIAALKALGLPTKKGWRNYGGNLVAKAMQKIAADPTKAATTRMMASLLAKADLRNLLLHIESDARLRYAGIYQPMDGGRGEIGLNLRALGRGSETGVAGDIATSLVHEALHHATYRALRSPKNAVQKGAIADLEALRKRARAALAANEALSQFDYELSNEDEFISGLFTRPDFQAALAKIPAEQAPSLGQRVRTLLDEIFRTLAELVVGRKVEPGSVLDAAFSASLRLMEDGGPSVQAASTPADSAGIGQDSAAGLFRYAPRDESTLDARERAALNAVRDAYPGERVEPLRLQNLQPSPDGPRRGQMRRDSLREWSGIFGRLFGKRILFIDGPARLNGASASGQRNVIVVNANSREPLLYVLGHELTHALKAQRPQLYQELEREILRSGENLEKYRDKLRKLKYAEKELNNELVADFIGSQMLEPKFLNQLAATKPPLFERFAQAVVKFLDSLLSKVSKLNRDVRPYFEQKIQPLREQLAAVLKDYAATGVFPDNPLDDSGDVNLSREGLMNPATDPNLTRSRFAPPREADQVINTREDAQVALEAGRWLASVDQQTAIEQFVANAVPLPLDAQQHAAGLLIAQLSAQYDQSSSEVERMWNHVQMQRMARVWKSEFLSADPARSQRQRAVVNNTILQPISAVLAAQEVLIDRGTRVTKARFEGGGEGVVTRIVEIIKYVDRVTGEVLSGELSGQGDNQTGRQGDKAKAMPSLTKLLNDLRKKMLPGMTWEEIFTDLPSTQKARQRAIYERLKKDQRLQALTPEERLKLTNELDKAWQRERRKVFRRELDKAGVLGEKAPSDRQKVKNAMPKLLRLINLGMFNSEMFREAIAPEYGLRVIDAATAAKLRHLAEAAYSMPEGILRNRKLGELLHSMQAATGSSVAELVNSYWTASVLSGLRTQFDTWLAFVNGMGTNLMQAGALLARGQGRNAIGAHAAWWRGLRDGVRESLQILARGDYSVLKKFGADLNETLKGEKNWRPVPLGESLWQNGNVWQKYLMAPVMIWTGRLMAAADHINNTATTAGAMAVARAMHPELYNGRGDFTPQERADARAQALREITGGNPPMDKAQRTLVDVRTREILYATVSEDLRQTASDIGDVAAYQNDPTGMFGTLYRVVKGALGTAQRALDEKAQDMDASRFTRALVAALSGSLYGVTGTRFIRFGFNFGADLTRYIPGTALFKDVYGTRMSRMEQDLLIGKNIVGLMITSTLAALFLTGDDEDEGWQIEGDWSNLTPQEQKARMAAGIERMTLWKREDGQVRRVSYKQWPTMALFAAVGGMLDEKRHRPDQWAQRGVPGHLLRGALTGVYQVKNVTAMRGLMELFGESSFGTDKSGAWGDALIRAGSNFVGGAVPTLVKDAEVWNDPRSFKPEGVLESVMRGMPIARKFVNDGRPQLNLLGEEVKLQRAPWSRAYTSVASAEAHRVLGALMARGLSLPQPSDQIAVYQGGVKMPLEKLGREAVWRYERAVGEGYRAWLSEDGNRLLAMPVAAADKVIAARANAIKQQALARVTGR